MRATSPFTRRRFLKSTLASTVAIATTLELQRAARALGFAANADVCRLMAEQEVGPYYVADELMRSNITEGKPGVPLTLRIAILDARTCKPLQHAAIDIWHCDALGIYSGYTKQSLMGPGMGPNGPNGMPGPPPGFDPAHPENRPGPPSGPPPGGPPQNHPTDKLTFCRGIQMTGADGSVQFETVFPRLLHGPYQPHPFQGAHRRSRARQVLRRRPRLAHWSGLLSGGVLSQTHDPGAVLQTQDPPDHPSRGRCLQRPARRSINRQTHPGIFRRGIHGRTRSRRRPNGHTRSGSTCRWSWWSWRSRRARRTAARPLTPASV